MRRHLDAYYTPRWMTDALYATVPEIGGHVLEPCVGDGAIADTVRQRVDEVTTNDINPDVAADFTSDATLAASWARFPSVDWVITNPPFAPALMVPILQHALEHARVGVIVLGRISFLEPTKGRGAWIAAHPPDRYLVTERHSFTGNGKSDSATTAWMVWSRKPLSGRAIACLHGWKPRDERAQQRLIA